MKGKKGGFWQDNLGWILLGILVLVFVIGGFIILKQKDSSAIEFIKNLFRLRR
ncbi:MAG: hypothetical protein AABX03_00445 [Nanoarchaeota archaeon]